MALYRIKTSFMGSPDGSTSEPYEAGTVRDLTDYLVSAANPAWIERADGPVIENKAIITEGRARKVKG